MNIVDLDLYRPHVLLRTSKCSIHQVPVIMLRDYVQGKTEIPEKILKAIVRKYMVQNHFGDPLETNPSEGEIIEMEKPHEWKNSKENEKNSIWGRLFTKRKNLCHSDS